MARIEKTVFISYRRANEAWALAIYQDLISHGYDAFYDFQSLDSGNFEIVIIENIKARAHFILILTPSALERCKEPDDWLRREIETAIDERRNIVPIMVESFDFGSSGVKDALTGKLSILKNYNGLRVPSGYFFEAMDRLRNRFLNIALSDIPLRELSAEIREITETQKAVANATPPVSAERLNAQEWFERGFVFEVNKNFDEAIRCYSEAIHLAPNRPEAYHSRGYANFQQRRFTEALADYNRAIELSPSLARVYIDRGTLFAQSGEFANAQKDYYHAIDCSTEIPELTMAWNNLTRIFFELDDYPNAIKAIEQSLQLYPINPDAFANRSLYFAHLRDYHQALKDVDIAIELNPNFQKAYYNRGKIKNEMGLFETALEDYNKAIELNPQDASSYINRGNLLQNTGSIELAIADYTQAIQVEPYNPVSYFNFGVLLVNREKLKDALTYFEKAKHLGHPKAGAAIDQIKDILR